MAELGKNKEVGDLGKVIINRSLYNKGVLHASQDWIDEQRIRGLLLREDNPDQLKDNPDQLKDDPDQLEVSVDIFTKIRKGKEITCYLMGEGHYRSSMAIIRDEDIEAKIKNRIVNPEKRKMWGFNKILNQVKKVISAGLD